MRARLRRRGRARMPQPDQELACGSRSGPPSLHRRVEPVRMPGTAPQDTRVQPRRRTSHRRSASPAAGALRQRRQVGVRATPLAESGQRDHGAPAGPQNRHATGAQAQAVLPSKVHTAGAKDGWRADPAAGAAPRDRPPWGRQAHPCAGKDERPTRGRARPPGPSGRRRRRGCRSWRRRHRTRPAVDRRHRKSKERPAKPPAVRQAARRKPTRRSARAAVNAAARGAAAGGDSPGSARPGLPSGTAVTGVPSARPLLPGSPPPPATGTAEPDHTGAPGTTTAEARGRRAGRSRSGTADATCSSRSGTADATCSSRLPCTRRDPRAWARLRRAPDRREPMPSRPGPDAHAPSDAANGVLMCSPALEGNLAAGKPGQECASPALVPPKTAAPARGPAGDHGRGAAVRPRSVARATKWGTVSAAGPGRGAVAVSAPAAGAATADSGARNAKAADRSMLPPGRPPNSRNARRWLNVVGFSLGVRPVASGSPPAKIIGANAPGFGRKPLTVGDQCGNDGEPGSP